MSVFVDSNVLIDVFTSDPDWAEWSEAQLRAGRRSGGLVVNAIVHAEISVGFASAALLDGVLADLGCDVAPIPNEAAHLAGRSFARRARSGRRTTVLPDYIIGAHAAVLDMPLLTRNTRDFRTAFPTLRLVSPDPAP